MTKPSLHELITSEIYKIRFNDNLQYQDCEELAEHIIKIVRDYHLVESEPSPLLDEISGGYLNDGAVTGKWREPIGKDLTLEDKPND